MFPPASTVIIQVISSFGLCFFMFLVGLELDSEKIRKDIRASIIISFFGLLVPLIGAFLLAILFVDPAYSNAPMGTLGLFLTCALGLSALPVLARILSERRMLTTRLGGLSMTIAAVDDVIAWTLLAVVIAIVRAKSQLDILYVFLVTIAECLVVFYPIRRLVNYLVHRSKAMTHLSADTFLLLALILIAISWFTEVIGLSALIGSFQVGLIIPRNSNLSHSISEKMEYFVVSVLMPLYFCNSGLRTQFGLINDSTSVGYCVLLIFVATLTKIIGIWTPCVYLGIPKRISLVISILMSCKGLIALIVVNFGYDFGVITPKFFAILVLMVLVTTMQTVPLVDCVDPPSRAKQSAADVAAWDAKYSKQQSDDPKMMNTTENGKNSENVPLTPGIDVLAIASVDEGNDKVGPLPSHAEIEMILRHSSKENILQESDTVTTSSVAASSLYNRRNRVNSLSTRVQLQRTASARAVTLLAAQGDGGLVDIHDVDENGRISVPSSTATMGNSRFLRQGVTNDDENDLDNEDTEAIVGEALLESELDTASHRERGVTGISEDYDEEDYTIDRQSSSLTNSRLTDAIGNRTTILERSRRGSTESQNSIASGISRQTSSGSTTAAMDLVGNSTDKNNVTATPGTPSVSAPVSSLPTPLLAASLPTVEEADESLATLTHNAASSLAVIAAAIARDEHNTKQQHRNHDTEQLTTTTEDANENDDEADSGKRNNDTLSISIDPSSTAPVTDTGFVSSSSSSFVTNPVPADTYTVVKDNDDNESAGTALVNSVGKPIDGKDKSTVTPMLKGKVSNLNTPSLGSLSSSSSAGPPPLVLSSSSNIARQSSVSNTGNEAILGSVCRLTRGLSMSIQNTSSNRNPLTNSDENNETMGGPITSDDNEISRSSPPLETLDFPVSTVPQAPLEIMMAVSDTSYAAGIVSIANLFPPPFFSSSSSVFNDLNVQISMDGKTNNNETISFPSSHYTLLWLQENVDMPSAYMNPALSIAELRDSNLAFAMGHSRAANIPNGVKLSVVNTKDPWSEAIDEAIQKSIDFLILPHTLPMSRVMSNKGITSTLNAALSGLAGLLSFGTGNNSLPNTINDSLPTNDSIIRLILSQPLPCGTGILFDYYGKSTNANTINNTGGSRFNPLLFIGSNNLASLSGPSHAVLCPFQEGTRMAEPALAFLKRTAPEDIEVHLLRVANPLLTNTINSNSLTGELKFGSTRNTVAPSSPLLGSGNTNNNNGNLSITNSVRLGSVPVTDTNAISSLSLEDNSSTTDFVRHSRSASENPDTITKQISTRLERGRTRTMSSEGAISTATVNIPRQNSGNNAFFSSQSVSPANNAVQQHTTVLPPTVPPAIAGRGSLKLLSSRARTVVQAVDKLVRANPSVYSLVVLGLQPDYSRTMLIDNLVDETITNIHTANVNDPMAAVTNNTVIDIPNDTDISGTSPRLPPLVRSSTTARSTSVPIAPEIAINESVNEIVQILTICEELGIPVLVVAGQSINACADDW